VKVKNLNGTSDNNCHCDSWLSHWENFTGINTKYCAVSGCLNLAEVGGHVQKDSSADKNWYILPLCKACNNKTGDDLYVRDDVNLVSANVSETCGK